MVTILEGILLWLFTAQLALGVVDTEDLLGDECIEPGNSCAQYAMQLKVLRQTETVEDDCKDLPDLGEGVCKKEVEWARQTGVQQHPDWYPGLSAQSSELDFQCKVFQADLKKCPKPCGVSCSTPPPPAAAAEKFVPKCEGKMSAESCLCVFDIDRTLTSKQGLQDTCQGSRSSNGIRDTAYGGGSLVLSQLAASGLSQTFCSKCYVGIVSHGDGSGQLSSERKELLQALKTDAMEHLVLKAWNAAWSDMEMMTPFYVAYPDALKQDAVMKVLDWYASQEVCIQRGNTYFFDDKDENIHPFRGTGINAKQISCSSRDPFLGWGDVGLCGATQEEITNDKGVSVCKIDCEWTRWSPWSDCSATCGGGQRSRHRRVMIKPRNGGQACGDAGTDVQECGTVACPTTTTTTTTTTTSAEESTSDALKLASPASGANTSTPDAPTDIASISSIG